MVSRFDFSSSILGLPESGEVLATRFIEFGYFDYGVRKRIQVDGNWPKGYRPIP
jgi:hypothetical protein